MTLGVPKETREGESRVALTVDLIKKYKKLGLEILIEKSAGLTAGFLDADFQKEGCTLVDTNTAWQSDIVLKVNPPTLSEVSLMKKNSLLISFLEPHQNTEVLNKLALHGVTSFAMELIPRISRAQSMDALSSQANIAGYRAVIEAAFHYKSFFPMLMTSAGSVKAVRVFILGVGVAGLQAIATAKRLGAVVEAYDVRPEVKEQVQSLGGKFFEVKLEESGVGDGGYAKELSQTAKEKLQTALSQSLAKSNIIITTASVPGKKAPILVSEEVVKSMPLGSVIVDLAAATGGNCALTEAGKIVQTYGVTIVGIKNFPALLAHDASLFYAKNLFNLLSLMVQIKDDKPNLVIDLNDEIILAAMVTRHGERLK
ncbi:MAG: Re/Si-specific NAD(P)(+) transhydrogenase subunit alpha [Bdellovibrio sp.]|nr:Re/Si-specific NAD(P)(+) transhydrogenase subunit alpha [Bdellovibrio sp.]